MAFIFLHLVYLKSFQLSPLNSVTAEIHCSGYTVWKPGCWLSDSFCSGSCPSFSQSFALWCCHKFSLRKQCPLNCLLLATSFHTKTEHNQVQPEMWLHGWVFYGKWCQKASVEANSSGIEIASTARLVQLSEVLLVHGKEDKKEHKVKTLVCCKCGGSDDIHLNDYSHAKWYWKTHVHTGQNYSSVQWVVSILPSDPLSFEM